VGDDSANDDGQDEAIRDTSSSVLGGVVGAVSGLLVGSQAGAPVGALVGAATAPGASVALRLLLETIGPFRIRNVERTIQTGADEAGITPEQLAKALTADQTRQLLASEVVRVAMSTASDRKLRALATVLATGATTADSNVVDRELLFVRVLADLEEPHVVLLNLIGDVVPEGYGGIPQREYPRPWDEGEVRRALPDLKPIVTPILGTLARHRLIDTSLSDWWKSVEKAQAWALSGSGSSTTPDPGPPRWTMTDFGYWCLDRIRSANPKRD